jgi:hypothetical protein
MKKHHGANSYRNAIRKFPTVEELKLIEPQKYICPNCRWYGNLDDCGGDALEPKCPKCETIVEQEA